MGIDIADIIDPEVDVRLYGTFAAAITALGATNKTLLIPSSQAVTTNVTVPANVTLRFLQGGSLAIATACTVTINGGLEAPLCKIFYLTGTGVVVFGRPSKVKELVPEWWGAVADGATDDIVALQAMVDCSYASGGLDMRLSSGKYHIHDTLKLHKGVNYMGMTLRGAGGNAVANNLTIIDATAFNDRPAINIQGARTIKLQGMMVEGQNVAPLTALATHDPVLADWITAGCVDSQYAPYAGVTIDAYQGAAPGAPYPNDAYSRVGSSRVLLEDVYIRYFVVGLCISPANVSSASDQITLNDVSLYGNAYAYSCGSSQARSITSTNLYLSGAWCGITTLRHGQKLGNAPSMLGGVLQVSHKLFELGTANGANAQIISGLHCEDFGWIGELGVANSASGIPIVFTGCNFAYKAGDYMPRIFVAHRRVKFDSCNFQNTGTATYIMNFGVNSYYGKAEFDNCNFIGFANSRDSYLGAMYQYGHTSLVFNNCMAELIAQTDTGAEGRYSPNRYTDIDNYLWQYVINRYALSPAVTDVNIGGNKYKLDRLNAEGRNTASFGISSPVLSGGIHGDTFTFHVTNHDEIMVGDIILWKVWEPYGTGAVYYDYIPALRVTANTAGDCSALVLVDGIDTSYAVALAGVYICTPFFINKTESVGDTHSNTTVDNVTTIANWKVGDFIRGSGIPVNTRIIDITGTTITLSKSATITATGVSIYNCKLLQVSPVPLGDNGVPVTDKCTAVEYGDGVTHKTVLTFTLTAAHVLSLADDDHGTGIKVYDFPAGLINILGATIDGNVTSVNAEGGGATFPMALGSAIGADDNTLSGTEADIIPSTAIAGGTNKAFHAALAAPAQFDGTGTALDLYVNAAITAAVATGAVTIALTGTATITWINLGDY